MASFRKKLVILFGIILMAIAMGYYFGIYLPNKKVGIAEQQNQEQTIKETLKKMQVAEEQQENEQINPEIDIENTVVLCKNKEQFIGKKLISDGINFQVIDGVIFYKSEELERLCNSDLKEFNYEAEPSFNIYPAYKGEIDYSKYEGSTTAGELKYSQDGYGDGYFDGKDINLKLKANYRESEIPGQYKSLYFYGYLVGYIEGCEKSNPESKDCEYAKTTLGSIENLVSSEPEN
jgi:hypothetical protein